MIFNRDNKGADELRALTGNYYANNEFSKIESDIKFAAYQLKQVVGDAVLKRAEEAYIKMEEPSEALADPQQLVELVQRPIAILATLQLYRKNDVSHEDSGRKVQLASDDTEKIPWEWQLDRDDSIHMESYYMAVEQLISYLNEIKLTEWMESEQKKAALSLIIRTGRDFDKYFPIQSSERLFFLLVNFIREMQISTVKRAYGEGWDALLAEDTIPESDVHFAACKATALLAMSKALLRMPLQLIPGGVVRTYMAENGMKNSSPANLDDVQRLSNWLQADGEDWLNQMKDLKAGSKEDYSLLPNNDKRNKFCVV